MPNLLQGIAYLLWIIALIPIVYQLWFIIKIGLNRLEKARMSQEGESHVFI